MAKQINTTIGSTVKKVSQPYAWVGGVLKKIKKGVCGVGGVVKEFFTSELVIYEQGTVYVPFYYGSNVFDSDHLCCNTNCIDTEFKGYTGGHVIKTVNNLDVTGYNTINLTVKRTATGVVGYNYPYLNLSKVGTNTTGQTQKSDATIMTSSGTQTLSFKFSDFSGSGILQFQLLLTNSSGSATQRFGGQYYKIWLSTT